MINQCNYIHNKIPISNEFQFIIQQKNQQKMLRRKKIHAQADDTLKQFLQLQGQCKIQKLSLLKLNLPKAILLTIISVITLIGLFLLIHYKWYRVKIWFSSCTYSETTHVYIKAGPSNDDIEKIYQNNHNVYFYFKNLKYTLTNNYFAPVGLDYRQKFRKYISNQYIKNGLTNKQISQSREQFGVNQHPVQIPNYFAYMFQVLLKPFFLLQYIVCIAYFVQGYLIFAVLNLAFSIITTTINYILTYFSYKKIKDMAEQIVDVRVLRNGVFTQVSSNQLVPGDIIDPSQEIMCDCILLRGEIFVNEASLTGESIPIGKFSANNIQQTKDNNRWLYQGSKVVEKKDIVYALVVNTGYTSRRGRIIRKILTRVSQNSQIFKNTLIFLVEAFIISMILYFTTISFMEKQHISKLIVGFRFIDFLGWAFPPTFPIFFNMSYTFAIIRLKRNNIICIQPDKSVTASNLKIMCFDKTGTLTQNTVQIHQIYKFTQSKQIIDITQQFLDDDNQFICKIFSSCHTIKKINQQFIGDQIDLKMFLFSKYQIKNSKKSNVIFTVTHHNQKHKLSILKIHQFQSKHQSMSTLVRDQSNKKIYIFIKGAPQKLQKKSIIKIPQQDKLITSLSLGGYRTIAFAYRIINQSQLPKYLQSSRQLYQEGITLLGIVAFQNKLKQDTRQTIDKLVLAGIEPKIITGDNIFIAIETGVRAGVIAPHEPVLLLEGKKQNAEDFNGGLPKTFKGVKLTRQAHHTLQQPIQLKEDQNYYDQPYPIAVDNDFLLLTPQLPLTKNMKLFARISPQNKALVILKFKQLLDKSYKTRSFISHLCGDLKYKVGMCGDGANDLMAIRQSDVGIGINNSDANYGATFTIADILQVDEIIRDSKATTANIVQMIRYYQFISFLKIPSALLMVLDSTYFNQSQLLFMNFTSTVIYPIFQSMSKPSKIVTAAIPDGNLFGIVNHFRFWGSLIIATAGLAGGYFYFRSTPNFQPNPHNIVEQTWFPNTFTGTCMFLLVLPPFAIYSLFFYIGQPWKQKVYKNYLLFTLMILNSITTVIMHFITKYAYNQLGLLAIARQYAAIVLLISIGACIFGYIYNKIITQIQIQCSNDIQRQQIKLIQ